MIGTCIAMAIWTSGLLYMTRKSNSKRLVETPILEGVQGESPSTKNCEGGAGGLKEP